MKICLEYTTFWCLWDIWAKLKLGAWKDLPLHVEILLFDLFYVIT